MKLDKYKFEAPEGSEICDICNGFGSIITSISQDIAEKDYRIKKCERCKGLGCLTLTWVEKVFWKKE